MIKQLLKGMATFIPGVYSAFSHKGTGGTESGRYCYSVWLRHLVMAHAAGRLTTNPETVAELGPGDSIGIGLAALISGAGKYYALDIVRYANLQRNVKVFAELVELFRDKENIPGDDEFPDIIPRLSSYTFPEDILTADRLNAGLENGRLEVIRRSIQNEGSLESMIQYMVPWHDSNIVENESVDLIFSQAALEHIEDMGFAYEKMFSWLKSGGYMSHSIDYKCHGSADEWNGHWTYSDFIWKLIKGKRPYLINRLPHSEHLRLMNETGFKIVNDVTDQLPSRISREDIAPRFRKMSEEDLITSRAFIQASRM